MQTHVAFTVNRFAVYGLGAVLTSMVRSCSNPAAVSITILEDGLTQSDKRNINTLLMDVDFKGQLRFVAFDAKGKFGHLPALHGDYTPYGLLLLPDYVDADKFIYLDADVVVCTDVHRFYTQNLDGHLLGGISEGVISQMIDQRFLIEKIGLLPGTAYFNSGVLLVDAAGWRRDAVTERLMQLALLAGSDLLSHDQTLLNAYCKGSFKHLPLCYNQSLLPNGSKNLVPQEGIRHYQGQPKPFSPVLGKWHADYAFWAAQLPQWWHEVHQPTFAVSIQLCMRTWRSMIRFILKKYILYWSGSFGRLKPLPN